MISLCCSDITRNQHTKSELDLLIDRCSIQIPIPPPHSTPSIYQSLQHRDHLTLGKGVNQIMA